MSPISACRLNFSRNLCDLITANNNLSRIPLTGAFPGGPSKIWAPRRNRARQSSSPVYRSGCLILEQTAQEVQCRKQPYPAQLAHFTRRWTAVNPFAPCSFQPRTYNGPSAWRNHPFNGLIDGGFGVGRGRNSSFVSWIRRPAIPVRSRILSVRQLRLTWTIGVMNESQSRCMAMRRNPVFKRRPDTMSASSFGGRNTSGLLHAFHKDL
jgi:hypothetical protein